MSCFTTSGQEINEGLRETMKLRKSLVKPVMWQNISSYLVLLP